MTAVSIRQLCGALIIGGFDGTSLPRAFALQLEAGDVGGRDPLRAQHHERPRAGVGALQRHRARLHGGRPSCRWIKKAVASRASCAACSRFRPRDGSVRCPMLRSRRVAAVLGARLAALGFTLDYAPVLDVHTSPSNPVIGDRAFSTDAEHVAARRLRLRAWLVFGGCCGVWKAFSRGTATPPSTHTSGCRASSTTEPGWTPSSSFRCSARGVATGVDERPRGLRVSSISVPARRSRVAFRLETPCEASSPSWRARVRTTCNLEMRAIADVHGCGGCRSPRHRGRLQTRFSSARKRTPSAPPTKLSSRARSVTVQAFARCEEAYARVLALRRAHPPKPNKEALAATVRVPEDVARAITRRQRRRRGA